MAKSEDTKHVLRIVMEDVDLTNLLEEEHNLVEYSVFRNSSSIRRAIQKEIDFFIEEGYGEESVKDMSEALDMLNNSKAMYVLFI